MKTNKTFLILLLAGVSYTAYNATAVSENFEISTTIDHEITLGNFKAASADANLDVIGDIDLGTIIINKDYDSSVTSNWKYNESGQVSFPYGKGSIVSADNAIAGIFNANIPTPNDCNTASAYCGGLSVTANTPNSNRLEGMFNNYSNCEFYLKYTGSENKYKVYPISCSLCFCGNIPSNGTTNKTLTISYTPS
ncbi:MAG: hypothetical protein IJ689_04930 [Alphaproteobacteria bacterium]|nr:hypothetical protein [Alphaproteobacteria bacterium]